MHPLPPSPLRPDGSWLVRNARGQQVCVPGTVTSLTTFVLIEQERWFEAELARLAELLEQVARMGYRLYRHNAALGRLVEFVPEPGADLGWTLNMFALRGAHERRLAAAGIIVRLDELASALAGARPDAGALAALAAMPAMRGLQPPADDDGEYRDALAHAATALDERLPAAERLAQLVRARQLLEQAVQAGRDLAPHAWALLVHCLHRLGQRGQACAIALELWRQWPAGWRLTTLALPPVERALHDAVSGHAADWLRHRVGEFAELNRRHSSFFHEAGGDALLEALAGSPWCSVEIERRRILQKMRRDEPPRAAEFRLCLDPGRCANHALWSALAAGAA